MRTEFSTDAGSVALGLLTSVSLLLSACGGDTIEQTAEPSIRPVKLIEIDSASDERSRRYPAVIDATQSTELSFRVGGQIEELPVNDAQVVAAGDLIARLDQRDIRNSVAVARSTFQNAEDEFQRASRLAAQDAIATSVLEQRRSQRDVAKAQLDTAEKALSDSVLRAPFAGAIASIPVRRSETVAAGTTIATVISTESLDATINLPASVIAEVPTREDRGAVVVLEAAPGREIEATYKEANLVADATSQTYAVTFSFVPPSDMLVLPGMNATVVLRSASSGGSSTTAVTVPLAAVQSDSNGQYVWLVDESTMTVSRRAVEIRPGIGETVAVMTGLSKGDRIVGAGGAYLAEGLQVSPWTE